MRADGWYVHSEAGQEGPLTVEEVRRRREAGALTDDHFAWHEGMDGWRRLGDLPIFAGAPAAAAAAAPAARAAAPASGPWDANPLLFRRQFFRLLGAGFRAYDPAGHLVLYSEQKAFTLKEDIRVYADEGKTREVLRIAARQVIDFSAAYDVHDGATNEKVGALRRKGWSSLVRDSWEILDAADAPIGRIEEDSTAMALVRRFVLNIIPQSFTYTVGGAPIATFRQGWNPFVFKGTLDVTGAIDRRLAIAATILLLAIEGRQG